MTTKQHVLAALEGARGQCISGEALAASLGLSRAAVWKAIKSLRAEGVQIASIPSEGYRLLDEDDSVTAQGIGSLLETRALGQTMRVVPTITSTNSVIKQEHLHEAHGFTLVALEQTAGRGRLGRSFASPEGTGIYFSVLLHPDAGFTHLGFVTIAAAVALTDAIEALCGFSPAIKWVNDVLKDGKKLCGILTEATLEGESGTVTSIIVGMGINLMPNPALPSDARNTAGALSEFGTLPRKAALVASVLNRLERTYDALCQGDTATLLDTYRARLCCIGQRVLVTAPSGTYDALCTGLDDAGHLLVQTDSGDTHALSSGEISIRLS